MRKVISLTCVGIILVAIAAGCKSGDATDTGTAATAGAATAGAAGGAATKPGKTGG